MPESPEYLFVYGTLRASAGHRMNKMLEREAERIGRGRVPGVLYDIGRYPGAVRRSGVRAYVHGDVYRLKSAEQTLKVLDRYEGLDDKNADAAEFKRSRVVVDLGAGKKVRAWIYLYNRPTTGLPRIPSGDYLRSSTRAGRVSEKRAR